MTAAGIGQTHSLFKEFFNLVYQGTKFALVRYILIPGYELVNTDLEHPEDEVER